MQFRIRIRIRKMVEYVRLRLSDDRILCLGLCAIAEYGLFFEVEAPTAVFQQEGRGYIREGAETFATPLCSVSSWSRH